MTAPLDPEELAPPDASSADSPWGRSDPDGSASGGDPPSAAMASRADHWIDLLRAAVRPDARLRWVADTRERPASRSVVVLDPAMREPEEALLDRPVGRGRWVVLDPVDRVVATARDRHRRAFAELHLAPPGPPAWGTPTPASVDDRVEDDRRTSTTSPLRPVEWRVRGAWIPGPRPSLPTSGSRGS